MVTKTKIFEGTAHVFGDNVSTDEIMPLGGVPKNLNEFGKYAMTAIDPDFPKKAQEGDFVVAGKNFGCGSSRESAPTGLKQAGIRVVIAQSFARIFYRNCVNIGLLPLICADTKEIQSGSRLRFDREKSKLILEDGRELDVQMPSGIAMQIVEGNGLMRYMAARGWSF